jgi:hypothetical protein
MPYLMGLLTGLSSRNLPLDSNDNQYDTLSFDIGDNLDCGHPDYNTM